MDWSCVRWSLVIISCAVTTYGFPAQGDKNAWDVIVFTQNWPRAVCAKWQQTTPGGKCNNVPANTWTIHGLWPTKLGTTGPDFCDNSRPYRPNELLPIQNQLSKSWASVHGDNYRFWSHEWTKHGTCWGLSQMAYFTKALEWNHRYNIFELLRASGITPGGSYSVQSIVAAVRKAVNAIPQVNCYHDGKKGSVLTEVRLCFDKNLQPTDCDGGKVTNCRQNQLVNYPL